MSENNSLTMNTFASKDVDIWKDIDEAELRSEWRALFIESYSVKRQSIKTIMNSWNPKTKECAKKLKQNINQIRIDTSRTWGTNSAFASAIGRECLERVLVSWVVQNPQVGYVQGFNFIVAMILAVFRGNQDDTLTIFTKLMMETSFGDYFCLEKNFEALHEDTKRIECDLKDKDPILSNHLQALGFQFVYLTPTWLLTCFFLQIGPKLAIKLLNKVIRSGLKARDLLIEFAVHLICKERNELLTNCQDMESVLLVFKRKRDNETVSV